MAASDPVRDPEGYRTRGEASSATAGIIAQITGMAAEMRARFTDLERRVAENKTDLRALLAETKADLQQDISDVRVHFDEVANQKWEAHTGKDGVHETLEKRLATTRKEDQTRTYTVIVVGLAILGAIAAYFGMRG